MSDGPSDEVVELATKLFDLARAGDAEALAAYVDAGVSANLSNHKGDSLVMLAAYHGHAKTVRALVSRGADANRPNDRGQTPPGGSRVQGRDRGGEGAPGRRC